MTWQQWLPFGLEMGGKAGGIMADLMGGGGGPNMAQQWGIYQQPQNYLIGAMTDAMRWGRENVPDLMGFNVGASPLRHQAMGGVQDALKWNMGAMAPSRRAWGEQLLSPDVANNPYVNAMLGEQQRRFGQSMAMGRRGLQEMGVGGNTFGGSRGGAAFNQMFNLGLQNLQGQQAQTQLGAYGMGLRDRQAAQADAPFQLQMGNYPLNLLSSMAQMDEASRRGEVGALANQFQTQLQLRQAPETGFANTYRTLMPGSVPTQADPNYGAALAGGGELLSSLIRNWPGQPTQQQNVYTAMPGTTDPHLT